MLPLNYWLYLQIILFLFITPGSPRVLIVSYSMNYGLKKSVWTALGDITANILQGTLVIFGIGTLIQNNSLALIIIKWCGVIYLLYLAFDLYKSKMHSLNSEVAQTKSRFSFFKDGFLVAGLSPKAWIFFGVIFMQFLDFSTNYVIQFLILMITYVSLDFISLIIYGAAAEKISIWLKANPKVINTISACALLIIAIAVAFFQ